MTQLMELKDRLIQWYSKYETYLYILVKFIVAFAGLLTVNANIGYMKQISNVPVALLLALFGALMPIDGIILVIGAVVLLDLYSLALEAVIVGAIVFMLIYLLYFRFAPKNGINVILTPIAFRFNIPYIVPVANGLLRPIYSIVSVICGTVAYYFLIGIHQNASVLTSAISQENTQTTSKLNVILGQLLGNDEMYLVIVIMSLTIVIVNYVSKMTIEHAWTIAIIAGTIFEIAGLSVGFLVLGISGKGLSLILGSIVSLAISFVIKFIFMDLDYARTERVQFEDDDYYYYVVAIPKKMVASRKKKVQHFSNTATMGKKLGD